VGKLQSGPETGVSEWSGLSESQGEKWSQTSVPSAQDITKNGKSGQDQWLTPVIPVMREAEVGGSLFKANPDKKCDTLPEKSDLKQKELGGCD
jgi:hypothetical protein